MNKQLQILLVEDDHLQTKDLRLALERELKAEVRALSTESAFRLELETIAANPPDFAILDRMLRWANPARDMPSPPDDSRDPGEAGVRCGRILRSDPRTEKVRILLYSVLGDEGDTGGFDCVVKETEFQNLIGRIRELTPA